jgi:hypothetical protein
VYGYGNQNCHFEDVIEHATFFFIRLPTECMTYPQRYSGQSILLVHSQSHAADIQKLKDCKIRAVFLAKDMVAHIHPMDKYIESA